MPIAMVIMLLLEIFPISPVWHISPTFPIWFSVLHMAVLCGGRSIFPLFLLPHFPLSPFPFPLSLFLCLFFLGHFSCSPIFPISPLWCSKCFLFLYCHVSDCHRWFVNDSSIVFSLFVFVFSQLFLSFLSCYQRVHHGRGLWSKAQRPRPQTINNTSRVLYIS